MRCTRVNSILIYIWVQLTNQQEVFTQPMQKIIFIKSKNYSLEELYLNAAAFRHRQFS